MVFITFYGIICDTFCKFSWEVFPDETCKLWRNLFFPLLWERLEPCLTHSKAAAWYKVYGESLIRKSSLVCENPEIASHVRYVQIRTL